MYLAKIANDFSDSFVHDDIHVAIKTTKTAPSQGPGFHSHHSPIMGMAKKAPGRYHSQSALCAACWEMLVPRCSTGTLAPPHGSLRRFTNLHKQAGYLPSLCLLSLWPALLVTCPCWREQIPESWDRDPDLL